MQDVTHDEHVGARERVGEKVAGVKWRRSLSPSSGDVSVEERFNWRQVEAAAGQVRVAQRDRDWDSTSAHPMSMTLAWSRHGNFAAIALGPRER